MPSFTRVDDEGFLVAIFIRLLSVRETKTRRQQLMLHGKICVVIKVILSVTVTEAKKKFFESVDHVKCAINPWDNLSLKVVWRSGHVFMCSAFFLSLQSRLMIVCCSSTFDFYCRRCKIFFLNSRKFVSFTTSRENKNSSLILCHLLLLSTLPSAIFPSTTRIERKRKFFRNEAKEIRLNIFWNFRVKLIAFESDVTMELICWHFCCKHLELQLSDMWKYLESWSLKAVSSDIFTKTSFD